MNRIRMTDLFTDEVTEFEKLQDICDQLNAKHGTNIRPSNISSAINRRGTVVKKRYSFEYVDEERQQKKNKTKYRTRMMTKNGWELICYGFSPSIIIAEKRLRYDFSLLWELKRMLRLDGHFFSWNEADEERGVKKTTRAQVYVKVDKDMPFNQKVDKIMSIIDRFKVDASLQK